MVERLFDLTVEFDVEAILCQCLSSICLPICLTVLLSLGELRLHIHASPLRPSVAFILQDIFCRANLLFLAFLLSVKDGLIWNIAEILMQHPLEVLFLTVGLGHRDVAAGALHSAGIESARPQLLHMHITFLIECCA